MLRRIIRKFTTLLDRLKNRPLELLHRVAPDQDLEDSEQIKRYLDQDDRRHYQENGDDVYSVTTVLDKLEGEKWYLKKWKENNDGVGDNPDWEDILEYKQNRGTMAHYAALADYEQFHDDPDGLWSGDERSSLDQIYDRVGDEDFLYSVAADRGWVPNQEAFEEMQEAEDISIEEVFYKDMDYFTDKFDEVADERGINEDTIESVEEMFLVPPNHEHDGYGGQVDLVYRDPLSGGLVVADLKTSKDVYDKHKYQAAAYATAMEKLEDVDVERAEIIRINPDQREVEVTTFTDFEQYWDEFAETTKEM